MAWGGIFGEEEKGGEGTREGRWKEEAWKEGKEDEEEEAKRNTKRKKRNGSRKKER